MNETNIPRIPLRPILYNLVIDDRMRHRKFCKRGYKQLSQLKMEYISLSLRRSCYSARMQRLILQIAKKYKQIYKLCLQKYLFCCRSTNANDLLKVIKKFPHITSLSLPLLDSPQGQVEIAKKWLYSSKFLKELKCRVELQPFTFFDSPNIQSYYLKLSRAIRLRKIESLAFSSDMHEISNINPLAVLSTTPSTLKSLTFVFPDTTFSLLEDFNLSRYNLSLAHLHNLHTFHLDLSVPVSFVINLLSSIPNLSNLTSLLLKLENNASVRDTKIDELMDILKVCDKLDSLTLKLLAWPRKTDSWKFLSQCPLKSLRMESQIRSGENMVALAGFVGSAKALTNLHIKLTARHSIAGSSRMEAEHFDKLFEAIGKLEHLESLEVSSIAGESSSKIKSKEGINIVPGLSLCLEKLSKLRNLSIRLLQAEWNEDFGSFAKVLKNYKLNLEKLEVHIEGANLSVDHWKMLGKALETMKKLKNVSFGGLHFDEKEKFDVLSKMIIKMKGLETLELVDCCGKKEARLFADMLADILMNSGLKSFRCNQFPVSELKRQETVLAINFKAILKSNPNFRGIYLPCRGHNLIFHLLNFV